MAKVIVQHHVSDYDRWYPVFTDHGAIRREHGATGHAIHRGVEDPNTIVVVNEFSSLDGARAFLSDPSLKEAMSRAGVDSEPQVWVVEEAERQTY
jgi:quinol monooxygenase YgiN